MLPSRPLSGFSPRSDVTSWGRVEHPHQFIAYPTFRRDLASLLKEAETFENGVLGRGFGRSYGDTNLNRDGGLIDCTGLDRLISFDSENGVLRAEAGISLKSIVNFAVPRGFFLGVTPGTQYVTLAGAIANDVHGKNHHGAGAFGCWVEDIGLLRSDGGYLRISPSVEPDLFAATIGGLGLTGIITDATIRLRRIGRSTLAVETIAFKNLSEFFRLSEESASCEYTVAWIDCLAKGADLGRGIFSRADHSADGSLSSRNDEGPSVPLDAPKFLLNRFTIGLMNAAYYRLGRYNAGRRSTHFKPFFYPLDRIRNWNRLYGRAGMYQYQSVVPQAVAQHATAEMLSEIAKAGQGSFLVVLKTFGPKPSPGMLSFPAEGTTLALDFPNRGSSTLQLLSRLDDIVAEAGGRLYPAKDGRLPPALFRSGYPLLDKFREQTDPSMSSSFWRRMGNI